MERLLEKFRDSRGVAVVEFAVVVPLLVLLVAGVFDLGNALQQEIRLYQAARAGAQYALSFPVSQSSGTVANPAIVTAIQNAGSGLNVSATATLSCYCPDGTSTPCTTSTCSTSGLIPERYIDIVASSPFQAMIVPLSTIKASILERVQ